MTDTNRIRLSAVRETTLGVTPPTPRMRAFRVTDDGLAYAAQYVMSDERRDDRMTSDPIKVGEAVQGPITTEMHFPRSDSMLRSFLESLFFNATVNTPERDNDGTADSAITAVTASTGTVTVTTGASFAIGHVVRHTGFGLAANNGTFRVTTGGATSYVCVTQGLVDEAAPPGTARVKVVGFQGTVGDIAATATGLSSTTLNFTTLGLQVGQWIKIGAAAAPFNFAGTPANNSWARITAITATALTLDNRPPGWGVDAGTGRTIRVYFGDRLVNGVTTIGHTIEKSYLGQAVPTHVLYRGMVAGTGEFTFPRKNKIAGTIGFMGLTGQATTVSVDASPDPAPSGNLFPVMSGSANVGRVAEAGAQLAAPNWVSSINLSISNNLRMIEALDSVSAVDIGEGEFTVSATAETYFGDSTLLAKAIASTPTSLSWRAAIGNQATVWDLGRSTIVEAPSPGGAKNGDAMLRCVFQSSRDDLTGSHLALDMLEFFD